MNFFMLRKQLLVNLSESENGIFNAILRGHIDFTSDPWPSISPHAKDLVRKMLTSDPKQRMTAIQVLSKYALISSTIFRLYAVKISQHIRFVIIMHGCTSPASNYCISL